MLIFSFWASACLLNRNHPVLQEYFIYLKYQTTCNILRNVNQMSCCCLTGMSDILWFSWLKNPRCSPAGDCTLIPIQGMVTSQLIDLTDLEFLESKWSFPGVSTPKHSHCQPVKQAALSQWHLYMTLVSVSKSGDLQGPWPSELLGSTAGMRSGGISCGTAHSSLDCPRGRKTTTPGGLCPHLGFLFTTPSPVRAAFRSSVSGASRAFLP